MPYYYPGIGLFSTSPPVIARGLIVVGGAVNDNVSTTEPWLCGAAADGWSVEAFSLTAPPRR